MVMRPLWTLLLLCSLATACNRASSTAYEDVVDRTPGAPCTLEASGACGSVDAASLCCPLTGRIYDEARGCTVAMGGSGSSFTCYPIDQTPSGDAVCLSPATAGCYVHRNPDGSRAVYAAGSAWGPHWQARYGLDRCDDTLQRRALAAQPCPD